MKKTKYLYSKEIIIFCIPLLIIGAKLIRYTIMKTTLVDPGIGHFFLIDILNSTEVTFRFFSEGGISEAGGNTITIFKLLNIFNLDTYIEFEIYITILWNLITLYMISKVKSLLELEEFIFLLVSIVVLNIFDFTLAKEPIQMLFFLVIFMILINKRIPDNQKFILSISTIIFSALFFRIYYLLIAFFSIVIWIIIKKEKVNKNNISYKRIIMYFLTIGIIYFLFLNVCKVIKPNEYLELIRVRTRVGGAKTDMINILPSNNLVFFTIDYLLMLIRMLFPIELIPLGIKYLPYVGYQIMITILFMRTFKTIKDNKNIINIALTVYLGFLFGSAAFEPDFGSWVRHEAVLFPILIIITNLCNKGARKVKNE